MLEREGRDFVTLPGAPFRPDLTRAVDADLVKFRILEKWP